MRFYSFFNILTLFIIQYFTGSFSLRILGICSCFTGHITPYSGIFRALSARGHDVELLMGSDCCQTKVTDMFKNATKCFSVDIFNSYRIKADSQLGGLLNVKQHFADNGTKIAFDLTHKFLEENADRYDIIVSDFIQLGSYIAAELHNIPAVVSYLGPMGLTPQDRPDERSGLIYLPETTLPDVVISAIEFLGESIFQLLVSDTVFEMVNQINSEFKMNPKLRNSGISFHLPFTYYYTFAPIIHMGPTDLFLINPEYTKQVNNVHSVGFAPDKSSFKKVQPDVLNFISSSKKPVVYMSLGTVFEMERSKLVKVLRELDEQEQFSIVWAASSEHYTHLSTLELKKSNILLVTGVAQLSLLMRQQVKVFITHAGANSLQEGIFSETPMLVFPGFGDQPANALQLVKQNLALPLVELTFKEISRKLDSILDSNTYSHMKKSLKDCRALMISFGGFEKAADIVEQVHAGVIKVVDPPPLVDLAADIYFKLYTIMVIVVCGTFVFWVALVRCCCKRLQSSKSKSE